MLNNNFFKLKNRVMRKVVLFVSIVFMSFSAFAQEWQDVLYLKNGSVIRGVLIEQIPNESVKIQTADGNVFVYQFGDVEKLAKEQKEKRKQKGKNTLIEGTELF